MRGRQFAIAWILSLGLSLATAALWARSYFVWYAFDWDASGNTVDRRSIGLAQGRVFFARTRVVSANSGFVRFSRPPGFFRERAVSDWRDMASPAWSVAGFVFYDASIAGMQLIEIRAPLWAFVIPLLIPSVVKLFVRRNRPGHCSSCGYDLTGNASGVCPECGNRFQDPPLHAK